jgi:glutathione-regulated potassium-efflux system ancillary protein KefF
MKTDPRILVIYAHPMHHRSRVNRKLVEVASRIENVLVHDLYEIYPDFHIDVREEQALLEQSDLIVLQHPLHWYSMPALLKEWIDVVFEHGWAYGHEGNALRGKDCLLAITTGGPQESYGAGGYHRRPVSDFFPPYEQTAFLCGMRWHPPLVLHGARRADEETIAAHAARYAELLMAYPNWGGSKPVTPAVIARDVYIHDPNEP